MLNKFALPLAFLLTAPCVLAQSRLYVDLAAPAGGDGSSWGTAFDSLENALLASSQVAVSGAGVDIWTGAGIYYPTFRTDVVDPRSVTFFMRQHVRVYGGFDGSETEFDQRDPLVNVTTLSGNVGLLSDATDNAYVVVRAVHTLTQSSVLDGFTISGGYASPINDRGAGLLIEGDPIISNCVIEDNHADFTGAGVQVTGDPSFFSCVFRNNDAGMRGGAVYSRGEIVTFTDCLFEFNNALSVGGGVYVQQGRPSFISCEFNANSANVSGALASNRTTLLDRCVFRNHSGLGGGAVSLAGDEDVVVDCLFIDNHSGGHAGALSTAGDDTTILRSTFIGNSAALQGGAWRNRSDLSRIEDCLFSGNVASRGGAIDQVQWDENSVIAFTTIVGNRATGLGGGLHVAADTLVRSCVIWNNQDSTGIGESAQITDPTGTLTADSSCIQGWTGSFFGTNTAEDPMFVDADGEDGVAGTVDDDYRLTPLSSVLNFGDSAFLTSRTDLDGEPRVVAGVVDSGAYEFLLGEEYPSSCSGDGGPSALCTPCPCSNEGQAGTIGGCTNSSGGNASLAATGWWSASQDTLEFQLSGATPTTFGILFSGSAIAPTNPGNPCFGMNSGVQSVLFVDGLRCAVRDVVRHGTRPTDSGGRIGTTTIGWGASSAEAGLAVSASLQVGQIRHFQVVYRDDIGAGCGTGLNTSQAISVRYVP